MDLLDTLIFAISPYGLLLLLLFGYCVYSCIRIAWDLIGPFLRIDP